MLGDLSYYKELIDSNFQHYILTVAALYENFVFLIEMLLRKIIVFVGRPPLSTQLKLLLDFRQLLINLGYRLHDDFTNCIDNHKPYFTKFLPAINELRNLYVHDYRVELEADGTSYKISNMSRVRGHLCNDAFLELDAFTNEVTANTIKFAKELLPCLMSMVKASTTSIPV